VLRDEFEIEYQANEIRMAEIKTQGKGVATLERINKKLKSRIDAYQPEDVDWDLFKRAFNSDVRTLAEELSDFEKKGNWSQK
jgi:hypothetical protein